MFNTQTSSKPRLKNNTIDEGSIQRIFAIYEQKSIDLGQFKQVCEEFVQSGGGNQPTKDSIISAIRSTSSRYVVLKKATDFMLAGEGRGV